ncbi:MAG: hypothetical protein V8R55_06165 [Dysosmobacter sp.]
MPLLPVLLPLMAPMKWCMWLLTAIRLIAIREILTTLYQRAEASALLLGSGRDGKELAARVAARVGAGCVTDAMALAEDGSWVRSVYGGSLQENVDAGAGAVVTVRSGTFGKPEEVAGRTVPVTERPWPTAP